MQPTLADNLLADRGDGGGACNMPRIPAGRYPTYSTTIRGTTNAAGEAAFVFEAERDTLFIGLSVTVTDGAPDSAFVNMTYCNTVMLDHSSVRTWTRCCDRKPIFLVGVADNKDLEFFIGGATPATAFKLTMHGFQGKGCCE